jgi:hypothetical protein
VAGEPLTRTQRAVIERVGADVVPRYAIVECGPIGFGCLRPREADTIHVVSDLHAVIQPGTEPSPGLRPRSLLLSSLRPSAPLVILNVSMGDQAVPESGPCGCPLEALGWTARFHTLRSDEKLVAGGMTFLDTDVVRVLEEVLPARFGGGSTHYQLVEDHGTDGRPGLRLLVHPVVGPVDPGDVAEAFLAALATDSEATRVMTHVWRDARMVEVERRPPFTTATGKILHLHVVQ